MSRPRDALAPAVIPEARKVAKEIFDAGRAGNPVPLEYGESVGRWPKQLVYLMYAFGLNLNTKQRQAIEEALNPIFKQIALCTVNNNEQKTIEPGININKEKIAELEKLISDDHSKSIFKRLQLAKLNDESAPPVTTYVVSDYIRHLVNCEIAKYTNLPKPLDGFNPEVLREFALLRIEGLDNFDGPTPLHWIAVNFSVHAPGFEIIFTALLTQLLVIQNSQVDEKSNQPRLLDRIANLVNSQGHTLFHLVGESSMILDKLSLLVSDGIFNQVLLVRNKYGDTGFHYIVCVGGSMPFKNSMKRVEPVVLNQVLVRKNSSGMTGCQAVFQFQKFAEIIQFLQKASSFIIASELSRLPYSCRLFDAVFGGALTADEKKKIIHLLWRYHFSINQTERYFVENPQAFINFVAQRVSQNNDELGEWTNLIDKKLLNKNINDKNVSVLTNLLAVRCWHYFSQKPGSRQEYREKCYRYLSRNSGAQKRTFSPEENLSIAEALRYRPHNLTQLSAPIGSLSSAQIKKLMLIHCNEAMRKGYRQANIFFNAWLCAEQKKSSAAKISLEEMEEYDEKEYKIVLKKAYQEAADLPNKKYKYK